MLNLTPISAQARIAMISMSLLFLLAAPTSHAATPPNIVVIMVDDLGYSDIGCYGGEIDTPNLDALAANGLRFSQFYNTAKCHSSRVSLLTGQYCLAAGNTKMNHAVTTAEVLGSSGYFTAMTGKWHLQQEPTDFGFDRYFGHLSGACNFFKGDKTFRLNGEPWAVPVDDFYTTVADVDYALKFLKEARTTTKPWYLYVAFNAPHAPLHALPQDYAKYKGKYDSGWDAVRSSRVAKQKEQGILPNTLQPSPRPEHIPAWQDLEPWRQKYETNRMTTLAAMIDRVDQEVGRLVDDLKANNEFDNTMILFVSDNGACPYDRKAPLLDVEPTSGDIALPDSTGWAWARNTPFRYYKQNQFEGGISTPAIVHWPTGLKTSPGSITDEPAHLIDVMPTLVEITQSELPDAWPNRTLRPISGITLTPTFRGESLSRQQPIHLLFSRDRGLRDGDWKIVSFKSEPWELYKVTEDRTELNDIAAQHPELVATMVQKWTDMSRSILHASSATYAPINPATTTNTEPVHSNREWTKFDSAPPNRQNRNRAGAKKPIRARKNTTLQMANGNLNLVFSGDDPGIAMDLRRESLPPGPYRLSFELNGGTTGGGELFFTTDQKSTLPKGKRISFVVAANGKWQNIDIALETNESVQQLRLDVSEGLGKASIRKLRLTDASGKTIHQWTK